MNHTFLQAGMHHEMMRIMIMLAWHQHQEHFSTAQGCSIKTGSLGIETLVSGKWNLPTTKNVSEMKGKSTLVFKEVH
jgi:hypothetical protein